MILISSRCKTTYWHASSRDCSAFLGSAQLFVLNSVFCGHSVWKLSGVLIHECCWGRRRSRRLVKKAQQFLVEALHGNIVSQHKKVTEENKTAELPGSASPTHTLTYKCRYATYSRRFTESNPPPHTHTLSLFCVSLFCVCSLTQRLSLRWSSSGFLMCDLTFASR